MSEEKEYFAVEHHRQVNDRYMTYYLCMSDIERFSKKYKNYVDYFNKKKADPEVQRIDECRAVTKEYWSYVCQLKETYPNYFQKKKSILLENHTDFVDLVKPLDNDKNNIKLYAL
ncbi:hypothetical protein DICPUDRAFT_80210 [Dictyostelium purpureum]|uniref:PIR Superfamily Protein n=1 Tax=Dictyostelium purpureum TaxID=5786 RepID=F0ZPU7_DICPU|nr:uncharacterized protein DICPUDRAFT_80210 [Dictyostelium purpureum]EGC34028.1 hypothetical protein DICPUDRAFT_80210 [Dictyostelium purpureum]|eukprot:XP_003289432.1 hypothetical protein DICPUDRAFT_80210 [Dictyostelium purpureum]